MSVVPVFFVMWHVLSQMTDRDVAGVVGQLVEPRFLKELPVGEVEEVLQIQ
jgi:hypothetical protein